MLRKHNRIVIRTHLENTAELLALMETANSTCESTAWFEEICKRCEANLDGLRLAELYAIEMVRELLPDDPEVAAVLALLLADTDCDRANGARQSIELLSHAVAAVRNSARWGLRLANCRCTSAPLLDLTRLLTGTCTPAAFEILAFHRIELPPSIGLAECPEETLWLFLEATGRSNLPWSEADLQFFATHQSQRIRQSALRASARRASPSLLEFCRAATAIEHLAAHETIEFLGLVGTADDLDLLYEATSRSTIAIASLNGIARLGSPLSLPILLECLGLPDLSESAASAIERITGTKVPRDSPHPPTLEMTEDELDLWEPVAPVDGVATRKWWSANASRFDPEKRYQVGLCVSDDPLGKVFDQLPLNIRYDVYLRQRALVPGTPDWELETWSWKQRSPGG